MNPCEECKSVKEAVEAASLHPSEWVRRFVRSCLKQPGKPFVFKDGHLRSAQRELAFLCPAALPNVREPDVTLEGTQALDRLRALLGAIWDLERAARTLCVAIITHVKKLITQPNGMPANILATHQGTLQDLVSWKARAAQVPIARAQPAAEAIVGGPDAPAGGVGGGDRGGGGPGDAAAATAGGEGPGVRSGAGGVDAEGREGAGGAAAPGGGVPGAPNGDVGGGRGGDGMADAAVGDGWGQDDGDGAPNGAAALGGGGGRARVASGRARQPAATARTHQYDRTTAEPGDPRCLRTSIKALGTTLYKDVRSFCVAIAIDPVVNTFKPRHGVQLTRLSDVLRGTGAAGRLNALIARCAGGAEALAAVDEAGVGAAELLVENRMLPSFLLALSFSSELFTSLRIIVADVLLSIRATMENYHTPRDGTDGSALRYFTRWGDPRLTPDQLRARFLEEYPGMPEEPQVTGAFFPGLLRCRPCAFSMLEEAELGTCAKHYKEVHKYYYPGIFTVCWACAHPKMIGFVVLDKREGLPALLNTILSYFALLPTFLI